MGEAEQRPGWTNQKSKGERKISQQGNRRDAALFECKSDLRNRVFIYLCIYYRGNKRSVAHWEAQTTSEGLDCETEKREGGG